MLIPGHIVHAPSMYEANSEKLMDFVGISISRFNIGVGHRGIEYQDLCTMEDQNKYLTRGSPCPGHAKYVSRNPRRRVYGMKEMRTSLVTFV